MSKVNPTYKFKFPERKSQEVLLDGLVKGDMPTLSQLLTIAESHKSEDQKFINDILLKLDNERERSRRIAISGPPGAGKSTFIDSLARIHLEHKEKVAIIATDPSSEKSKGSILGDKTRMENLIGDHNVFIRPIASGTELGGVAASTRKAVLLCEAAGYQTIFVETVGVGQSAFEVSKLVDFFILVLSPAAGDELQGIKKGIVEMAELIIINKNDGELKSAAKSAQESYLKALHLLSGNEWWKVPVMLVSSIEKTGLEKVINKIDEYFEDPLITSQLEKQRVEQNKYWFNKDLNRILIDQFHKQYNEQLKVQDMLKAIDNEEIHYLEAIEKIRSSLNG